MTFDVELDGLPKGGKTKWTTFFAKYELCMTGSGLEHLQMTNRSFLLKLLANVRVFARMSPKQKERVITDLKAMGHVTLMCGDGTNDVGALKHSNVGECILVFH